jgi:hypothetical protein
MSTLSVRLPNSLHRHLREIAEREGVSMNQLISSAVGEKVAALMTEDYLARARRGSRKSYEAALRRVPDVSPGAPDGTSSKPAQGARRAQGKRSRR